MGPDPPCKGAITRGKDMPVHAHRHSAVSCSKMAEPIDLTFGCGLWWAEGSTSSVVYARLRQCALIGWHIGATWRIRLNSPSAAAMRPYVKLLWPLVIIIIMLCKYDSWLYVYAVMMWSTFSCSCQLVEQLYVFCRMFIRFMWRYRDSAGNTIENTSIFSLNQMC